METKQNDFITIAEYATRRGVSVSAVYNRLGGTLIKYYKVIDGKKYISVEALVEAGITPPVEKVEEGTTPPVEAQDNPGEEGTPASQDEAPPAETTGTEERRGFWGRLFRGKKK